MGWKRGKTIAHMLTLGLHTGLVHNTATKAVRRTPGFLKLAPEEA